MKQQHIDKLASLMTNEKSEFRMHISALNGKGELRIGGSTFAVGTFELVAHYDGKEVSCSGHMGKQYVTITQVNNPEIDSNKPCFKVNITRRNGAFIKNDQYIKAEEYAVAKFFADWCVDVELDNKQGFVMSIISANTFNQIVDTIITAGGVQHWVENNLIRTLNVYNQLQFYQTNSFRPELSIETPRAKLEFRLVNPRNHEWVFTISSQAGMRKSVSLTWMGNLSNPKTDPEQGKLFRSEVGLILRQFLVQSGIRFIPS